MTALIANATDTALTLIRPTLALAALVGLVVLFLGPLSILATALGIS